MDILLSALASDLASRIISYLLLKYQKKTTMDMMDRLHELLLRASTIIEEADGRYISNQGMVLQLRRLREVVYEGHLMLDTFKGHTMVSRSFNLKKIQVTMGSLESTIGDMKEFVVFLMDCPRILRQPYITYLFMERCMFGRHKEKAHIISFLMQPSNSTLEVLPVIGPREIGKKTLVAHVCNEEMVKKQFSCIIRLNGNDLNSLENGSAMKRHILTSFCERCLLVVELEHDADLVAWKRFYSLFSMKNHLNKVILISCLQKVSRLGTTQALRLKEMHPDEFWYFFRTLSFGSENPDEHQVLLSIAIKIATLMSGDFVCANVLSRLLRANLSAEFWSHILRFLNKSVQWHFHVFGEHPLYRLRKGLPYYISNYNDGTFILCNSSYSTTRNLVECGTRKIASEDISLKGVAAPSEGSFELVKWRSPIPPYYSYLVKECVVQKASEVVPEDRSGLKRKRRV